MSTYYRLPGLARLLSGVLASLIAGAPYAANVASTHADYPRRTIRIIVPASSGAADDFFARKLGDDLAALYKQRVIIDNRPGAGGLIGNRLLSKAGADGYTLGMISVTRIISELMHEKVPYRSLGDIVGVAHVASITNVLAVSPTIPLRGARDFVTYARVRPGELNYASLGIASASHLAAEVFNRILRIDAVHIPYRNVVDSYTELAMGRVHYTIFTLPAALTMVRDGRLRALAVMTPKRSPTLPDVPSVIEIGLPEVQYDSWSGLVAPVGTPRRVVEQLHSDIMRGLRKPELRQLFMSQGAESTPDSTPDGFMRLMQDEYLRFQAIIRETGVKPE